jgi:hypothetical protein
LIFLTSSHPPKKTFKNRFDGGDNTYGHLEEGKKVDWWTWPISEEISDQT